MDSNINPTDNIPVIRPINGKRELFKRDDKRKKKRTVRPHPPDEQKIDQTTGEEIIGEEKRGEDESGHIIDMDI